MTHTRVDWQPYLGATRRRMAIARFHLDGLQKLLHRNGEVHSDAPRIPVQAYFDGVVTSVSTAIELVTQAIHTLPPVARPQGTFDSLSQDLADWSKEPLREDLRKLRNRITHFSYVKTPRGLHWTVQAVGSTWRGSRELLSYARCAVEYGERLERLLPQIEAEIVARVSHDAHHGATGPA
jgi:hypothetical protein